MSVSNPDLPAKELFRKALCELSCAQLSEDAAKSFREAFLAFGSQTEDNTRAMDLVTVSDFPGENGTPEIRRLAFKSGSPLSDVMNHAEGCDMPVTVRASCPELRQDEWDALLRVATMVLLSIESSRSV